MGVARVQARYVAVKVKCKGDEGDKKRTWLHKCLSDFHALDSIRQVREGGQQIGNATAAATACAHVMHVFGAITRPPRYQQRFLAVEGAKDLPAVRHHPLSCC
jgi:hypothetical protein